MNSTVLRRLLLPVDPEREGAASAAVALSLEELGVPEDDAEKWVSTELNSWSASGSSSPDLQGVVETVLSVGADEEGWRISPYYFGLHSKLISAGYDISWAEARELLSHVRLIADLALKHRMTAARIARVLTQTDDQAPRFSRGLDVILDALGSSRSLDPSQVASLLEDDRSRAVFLYGDSSRAAAAESIGLSAQLLGVAAGLDRLLRALADDGEEPFGPYLQMLHFLLVTSEYYDHFLREAYEFSPRGVVAELVFAGHPSALKAGNPFLNNAKKVRVLNEVWAEGADGNLKAARAFAALLERLDALPYPARRELAALIRAWLAKVFDAFADCTVELPEVIDSSQLEQLMARVAEEQSRTGGVLEQRIVDLFSLCSHRESRWVHVGIGESVNATNVSRRKCGDVEVIDSFSPTIVAYESHGGALGPRYVADHLRTLQRTLKAREADLAARAEAAHWRITIVFIAHGFTGILPTTHTLDGGWLVTFGYLTFHELRNTIKAGPTADEVADIFSSRCLTALRSGNTPNRVRQRVLDLIS